MYPKAKNGYFNVRMWWENVMRIMWVKHRVYIVFVSEALVVAASRNDEQFLPYHHIPVDI